MLTSDEDLEVNEGKMRGHITSLAVLRTHRKMGSYSFNKESPAN